MSEQSAGETVDRDGGLSRVEAFSDGVFAIAITLLVLQIEVPGDIGSGSDLWRAIKDQGGDLVAFAISFAVIGRIWVSHHQFVRTLRSFDGAFMTLNLLLLAFVVLIPFFSQVLGEYGELGLASALYAANLVALSVVQFLTYKKAVAADFVLPQYREEIAGASGSWLYNAIVFAVSIPLAALLGSYTPLIWLLLMFDPVERRRSKGAG
jgi:uncharacterized membrane protein